MRNELRIERLEDLARRVQESVARAANPATCVKTRVNESIDHRPLVCPQNASFSTEQTPFRLSRSFKLSQCIPLVTWPADARRAHQIPAHSQVPRRVTSPRVV